MMIRTAVMFAAIVIAAPSAHAQEGLRGTVVYENDAKGRPITVLAGGIVSIALQTSLRYNWKLVAARNLIQMRPMREIEPEVAEGVVGQGTTSVFEMTVTRPGLALITLQYWSPEGRPEKTVSFYFNAR